MENPLETAQKLKLLIHKWEEWEAEWLECDEVWIDFKTGEPKLPHFTGELYDSYIELQQKRDILMSEINENRNKKST
jgi:hypothetical protein